MANWTKDIEGTIFTYIKAGLRNKYPDVNFTTEEINLESPTLPTVYVHLLPMVETGGDLEGQTINAVMATFQVKVMTSDNKKQAKEIAYDVVDVLKKSRFSITMMPETLVEGKDITSAVLRARRIIGAGNSI